MNIGPAFGMSRNGDEVEVSFPDAGVTVTATVRDVAGTPQVVALTVQAIDPRDLSPLSHWSRTEQRRFRQLTMPRAAPHPPTIVTSDLLHAVPLRELHDQFLQLDSRPNFVDFNAKLPPRKFGPEPLTRDHYVEVARVIGPRYAPGCRPARRWRSTLA